MATLTIVLGVIWTLTVVASPMTLEFAPFDPFVNVDRSSLRRKEPPASRKKMHTAQYSSASRTDTTATQDAVDVTSTAKAPVYVSLTVISSRLPRIWNVLNR